MKLIQLPSGMWIRPDHIKMIVMLPREEGGFGLLHPPRVRIESLTGHNDMIYCESDEEATAWRDRLAAEVNGSCEGTHSLEPSP